MDNVFCQILRRAEDLQGSRAALAELLRVPASTLERWMTGCSHMPLRAFTTLLDQLERHEPAALAAGTQVLRFNIGAAFAGCERCAHEVFEAMTSQTPLPLSAELACRECGERILHRAVLEGLARRVIARRTAAKAAPPGLAQKGGGVGSRRAHEQRLIAHAAQLARPQVVGAIEPAEREPQP